MGISYGSLPFQQQIDFFNAKTPMPSAHWYDVQREMHDTAFVVAGAAKADLLADLKTAMQKAHQQGTTLAEFRKDFDKIIEKRGWTGWAGSETDAGRAWRTRVIYETNLRASYQAGRWQQVQAVKNTRPYLIYRHSHSVLSPRAEHVAWDGLVVRQDDPWVKAHWPPNGYGCKCTMFTLSERDLQRLGKSGPDTPPDDGTYDWKDPNTGEVHQFPVGIQPFWDYTPGASLAARSRGQLERKMAGLPADIGRQLKALIKSTDSNAERVASKLGIKVVDYGGHEAIGEIVNTALADFVKKGLPVPQQVSVNAYAFQAWAKQQAIPVEGLVAAFVPHKTEARSYLFLNPAYPFWDNLKTDADDQYRKGQWSTADHLHTINHEMGHFLHFIADPTHYRLLHSARFNSFDAAIAGRVRRYAQDEPIEFVAEVYAALLTGKVFDGEIIRLYQLLKGPMP